MTVPPAFLLSTAVPTRLSSVLPRPFPVSFVSHDCRHRPNRRRSYLRLSLNEDPSGNGVENTAQSWPTPTLEEELDAIDDVYMDRRPGEGERTTLERRSWVAAQKDRKTQIRAGSEFLYNKSPQGFAQVSIHVTDHGDVASTAEADTNAAQSHGDNTAREILSSVVRILISSGNQASGWHK